MKYDSRMKYKWDNENVMEYAVKQAEERGMEKGRRETKYEETKAIALNLRKMGIPLSDIEKATGLSIAEIEKL